MKYALSRWAIVHCLLRLFLFSELCHDYWLFKRVYISSEISHGLSTMDHGLP